jgi:hypothetical protein
MRTYILKIDASYITDTGISDCQADAIRVMSETPITVDGNDVRPVRLRTREERQSATSVPQDTDQTPF